LSTTTNLSYKNIDFWLRDLASAWLNTIHPTGYTHSVPVYYLWDSSRKTLYFTSRRDAAKVRHIEAEPAVRLQMSFGEVSIIAEGNAHRVEDTGELVIVENAWTQKYPNETFLNSGDALYAVRVTRLCVWEYRGAAQCAEWEFEHAAETQQVAAAV
jgi:general stress protein 26